QNFAFLKDPVIVNSLFLKKPERIEALGLVLLLALLLWRLVERALRVHVETTGNPLVGWDKKATQKPTAFMMMTKFAAVMVLKVGSQRQLAQPLSAVQQSYLNALGVPATSFTLSPNGWGNLGGGKSGKIHQVWDRRPTAGSLAVVKGHVLPISWHMSMALRLPQGRRKRRGPRELPLAWCV